MPTLFKKCSIRAIRLCLLFITTLVYNNMAFAIEEAGYQLISHHHNDIEIRDYPPQILATVTVAGDFNTVGNKAFSPLFDYISGANQQQSTIAMTAPVSQRHETIDMMTPVQQTEQGQRWQISFMMPAHYTMANIPQPQDPTVTIQPIPPRRIATIRYSGTWHQDNYQAHLTILQQWLRTSPYEAVDSPIWARYNSPYSLWFLRKNEILIPVRARRQTQ